MELANPIIKSFIPILLLILTTFLPPMFTLGAQPMDFAQYFDEFGQSVDLVQSGGHLIFDCPYGVTECRSGSNSVNLTSVSSNRVAATMPCSSAFGNGLDKIRFKLKITGDLHLQYYTCSRNFDINDPSRSPGHFYIGYSLCSDNDYLEYLNQPTKKTACTGNVNKFCIRHAPPGSFDPPLTSWCMPPKRPLDSCDRTHFKYRDLDARYCPVDAFTLCAAMVKNYTGTWIRMVNYSNKACPPESELMHFKFFDRLLSFGESFYYSQRIHAANALRLSAGQNRKGSFLKCDFRDPYGEFSSKFGFSIAPDEQPVQKPLKSPGLISSGSRVLVMTCIVDTNPIFGVLKYKVAVFDSASKVSKDYKKSTFQNATCELNRTVGAGIQVDYYWTSKNDNFTILRNGSIFAPEEPGEYLCHINFTYISCSPHRIHRESNTCEQTLVITPKDLNLKSFTPGEIAAMVIGPLAVGIGIIIGIIIAVFIVKRRRKRQTEQKRPLKGRKSCRTPESNDRMPYGPLFDLLAEKNHVLDFRKLKKEAARLITMEPRKDGNDNDHQAILEYLASLADFEAEEALEKKGAVVKVKGCRAENVPNRTDSSLLLKGKKVRQPRTLHVTKLFDYYGDTLLLCQAPMPSQFIDHWKAIWQEEIGVVIWIGGLTEGKRPKIDAYISLEEGEIVRYGDFAISTELNVHLPEEYDAYWVTVQMKKQRREMIFVHVHMWPDHSVPEEPAKLADLVDIINRHHENQVNAGLPGLMAHCSLGVQRSPALIAVYIAYQMWSREREVNIHGIIRYIRRHRWRSFQMGAPFAQVKIVYGVMQVLATRQYMEGLCALKVDTREHMMFDADARRADLKRLQESIY